MTDFDSFLRAACDAHDAVAEAQRAYVAKRQAHPEFAVAQWMHAQHMDDGTLVSHLLQVLRGALDRGELDTVLVDACDTARACWAAYKHALRSHPRVYQHALASYEPRGEGIVTATVHGMETTMCANPHAYSNTVFDHLATLDNLCDNALWQLTVGHQPSMMRPHFLERVLRALRFGVGAKRKGRGSGDTYARVGAVYKDCIDIMQREWGARCAVQTARHDAWRKVHDTLALDELIEAVQTTRLAAIKLADGEELITASVAAHQAELREYASTYRAYLVRESRVAAESAEAWKAFLTFVEHRVPHTPPVVTELVHDHAGADAAAHKAYAAGARALLAQLLERIDQHCRFTLPTLDASQEADALKAALDNVVQGGTAPDMAAVNAAGIAATLRVPTTESEKRVITATIDAWFVKEQNTNIQTVSRPDAAARVALHKILPPALHSASQYKQLHWLVADGVGKLVASAAWQMDTSAHNAHRDAFMRTKLVYIAVLNGSALEAWLINYERDALGASIKVALQHLREPQRRPKAPDALPPFKENFTVEEGVWNRYKATHARECAAAGVRGTVLEAAPELQSIVHQRFALEQARLIAP